MKRVLGVALAVLALLVAVVLVRAATSGSASQPEVAAAPALDVDVDRAVARLAEGLRFRTISNQDASQLPTAEFDAFERHLLASYPRVHASLAKEVVNGHSLLFTWEGSDPSAEPVLLMAHHDVVPVEPGTDESWEQPPYGGVVADGFIWGRGSMDDKTSVFTILEAVELLLGEGHRPGRTVYLAFGHDEEVGGEEGATAIAELMASRDVRLAWVLDEGGLVASGLVPGLEEPVAVVGIAEKGFVSVELGVEVEGGHSSMPPRSTAVGILARAITRIEANPMPARIDGATRSFFEALAPQTPFAYRIVLSNLWLFGPVLQRFAGDIAPLNAMVRTTTAATIFEGGIKENVLPSSARAVVNFRILPGDTSEGVAEHVRRAVDDDRVTLRVGVRSVPREPSAVSPVDGDAFALLARTIREIFPGVPVLPYLVVGGTDARHYGIISDHVYRFGPYEYGAEDIARVHGKDERLSTQNVGTGVRFFVQLLRNGT